MNGCVDEGVLDACECMTFGASQVDARDFDSFSIDESRVFYLTANPDSIEMNVEFFLDVFGQPRIDGLEECWIKVDSDPNEREKPE